MLAYEKGQACLLFAAAAAVVVVPVAAEMVGVVAFLILQASMFVPRVFQTVVVGACSDCRMTVAVAGLPSFGMMDLVAVAFGCYGTPDLSFGYSCPNPEPAEDLPCAEH